MKLEVHMTLFFSRLGQGIGKWEQMENIMNDTQNPTQADVTWAALEADAAMPVAEPDVTVPPVPTDSAVPPVAADIAMPPAEPDMAGDAAAVTPGETGRARGPVPPDI
jgi:hypothetical protein